MKRILLAAIFLFTFFLLASKTAGTAQAANIKFQFYADNQSGTIPITVSFQFKEEATGRVVVSGSETIAAGGLTNIVKDAVDTYNPPHQLRWWTDCTDPDVQPYFQILDAAGTYLVSFPTQDVHCQTPNARPYITNTACASVGWGLTGVGANGANIARFDIYWSQTSSDLDNPSGAPNATVGSGSRSYTVPGLGPGTPGTYYIRIRAVSPQWVAGEVGAAGSWSSIGSFNCASSIVAASPSGVYTSCNGTGAGATITGGFGWTKASGGSGFSEQWLDNSVANNNFVPSAYMQSANVGVAASSYTTGTVVNGTVIQHMAQGTRYYWRVNTKANDGNWYPSVTASFVTPTCPDVTVPTVAPTATPVAGTCGPGCTLPTHDVTWGRPTGRGAVLPPDPPKTCTSSELSCTISGLGSTIWWSAWYGTAGSGTELGSGGPAGTFWGGYTVSWSWRWIVFYCPVDNSTTYSCVGNPDAKYTAKFNDNGSGASNTITKTLSDLSPNQYYAWQANVIDKDDGVGDEYTRGNFNSGECDCPATPTPTPTPPPARITVSYLTDCVDGVNPKVHLTWTSNTGATGYTVNRDSANVTAEGLPNPLGGSARAWNSTAAQPGGAHNWYVVGTGGSFSGTTSNTLSVTTATCSPPPADPSNLVVSSVCNNSTGLPEITFTWTDNSNIEQGFWMDVSHDAFTGPSSTTANPSVWGVKGITRSGAGETGATGVTVQFIWKDVATTNTQGRLDSGDVDSAVVNPQLAPELGVTYYWRVKAYSADRQSNHIYPGGTDGADADTIADGSTIPPGVSFRSPTCKFDLKVENDPAGNDQTYEPGELVNFTVQVTNLTGTAEINFPGSASLATVGLGAWTQSNGPNITCPGTGVTPSGANTQSVAIPALNIGSSTLVSLAGFNAPTAPGSYSAYFYALPTCNSNRDTDYNWTNNGFQLTYAVSAKAWFRTTGGDVGAQGSVAVSNPSVPLYSQSSWVLAGNPLDANVNGKWELNNYTKPLFPSGNGGVYNYFNSRFASKATSTVSPPACNIAAAPVIMHCTGDMSVGATVISTPGNWIIFVDGNLNVTGDIAVSVNSTLVFIVRDNITINTTVTRADGVYIAGGTFKDYDNAGTKSRNTSPYTLTIRGAVYAHAFDLSAFLSNLPACDPSIPPYAGPSCVNSTTPTDFVIFQPRYLVSLSQLIGSPSVSWKEVAP